MSGSQNNAVRQRELMVVDNERDIGSLVETIAGSMGYHTTLLTDPRGFEEAYQRLHPDVVMIDMVMPHRDGLEIIDWLAERGGPAKVVFLSGYDPGYIEPASTLLKNKAAAEVHSLAKPFDLARLRAILD